MVARFSQLSALKDFLAFASTVRGDLASITAPPFILSAQSLCEFPSYWAEHPSLFSAAAHHDKAEVRMLNVLIHYLASLQRQYYVGRAVKDGLKKPLNPFLGELFFGTWTDKSTNSSVNVISEQVSHHPPTTACRISDPLNGVHAEAYSTQNTTLAGTSIVVRQSGHAISYIEKYNETYLMPLPDITVKSLLSGVPYPEINGVYKIVASSGFTAEIRFAGKSMWNGKARNAFDASIYRTSNTNKTDIYTAVGSWSDRFVVKDASSDEVVRSYDIADPRNAPAQCTMPAIDEQTPWESRRAWRGVIDSMTRGDVGELLKEKSKVENAQREMRKKEKAEGKRWERMFFDRMEKDELLNQDVFGKLAVDVGSLTSVETDRLLGTAGCWRFNEAKAKLWKEGKGPERAATPLG